MKQQSAATMGASAAVPAFLSKLWALVGDAPSNQLITWSQVSATEGGRRAGEGLSLPFPHTSPVVGREGRGEMALPF